MSLLHIPNVILNLRDGLHPEVWILKAGLYNYPRSFR